VNEHPILFSGPMVRAILDGSKTQTRRIVPIDDTPISQTSAGPTNAANVRYLGMYLKCDAPAGSATVSARVRCPYGEPGDRLWVREGFAPAYDEFSRPAFMADWTGASADVVPRPKFKPGIHMPRALSRIDLEIEAVRVERLHDITGPDILAEGFLFSPGCKLPEGRALFGQGWDKINGRRASWTSNPCVWVITFRRVRP